MLHLSGWIMFSGGAHWRWESVSTSEERLDGHLNLTLMAGAEINCRNIAWVLAGFPLAHPQTASLTQAWTRSRHFFATTQDQSQKLDPTWTQGNYLSWEQALHLVGTSHSPHWCPGTVTIAQVTLQLLTATTAPGGASLMGHLWPQCHVQEDVCSAGQWPLAPRKYVASSQLGNSGLARQEREEKSHLSPSKLLLSLKSPTTDQNPQTLAESLWCLPLPRAPQMIANNGQPGPGQHTHVASCTDLLGSRCCFVYPSFIAH